MTYERAIEILDPEHREHYESIEPVNEACRMGRKQFARNLAIDMDASMTVLEFITLTENDYGGDIIKKLKPFYTEEDRS